MAKTLVVPLDGSPNTHRAASVGAELARRWNAELLLVAVTGPPAPAPRFLERIAREMHAVPVRVEIIESRNVAEALARLVIATADPAVCMTTHARGRLGGAVLGTVTGDLLRAVNCPFVLIGPHCQGPWPDHGNRLLACLDESPTSGDMVEPASEWAKALDLDLWLTEIFHPRDVVAAQEPHRFLDEVVARLKPDLPRVRACVSWSAYPPGEIVELAQELDVSMIAMGTHSRAGMSRLALGSVTMAVAHQAPCPVLTMHPYRWRRELSTQPV